MKAKEQEKEFGENQMAEEEKDEYSTGIRTGKRQVRREAWDEEKEEKIKEKEVEKYESLTKD